jgi:uncharacterized membrane protein YkoI
MESKRVLFVFNIHEEGTPETAPQDKEEFILYSSRSEPRGVYCPRSDCPSRLARGYFLATVDRTWWECIMRGIMSCVGLSVLVGLIVLTTKASADDKKAEKIKEDKIPEKVMKTIKDRFPEAKITSAEKETEEGAVVYDIELTHKGRKYEMDIKEDGTLIEIEKQVDEKDLPEAVKKAVQAKYPKAKLDEIMEVNKVKDRRETPAHYEIVIVTADKKKMEIIVSLDGKSVKGGEAEKDKK